MSEIKLHQTTDAKAWTDEFMRLNPQGQQSLDWGTMIGWFANAIMCGMDHQRWKMEKQESLDRKLIEELSEVLDILIEDDLLPMAYAIENGEEIRDAVIRLRFKAKKRLEAK